MKEKKSLKRCDRGHFYDGGRFDFCPHCAKDEDEVVLTPPSPAVEDEPEVILLRNKEPEIDTTEGEKMESSKKACQPQSPQNHIRCARGHYYNGERFDVCPHCKRMDENEDIPFTVLGGVSGGSFSGTVQPAYPAESTVQKQDDSVTMHFYKKTFGTEPVVGWLVCVGGKESMHFGQDFRLKDGRNFIGRDGDMDICLNGDLTISRKRHAIVTYDRRGNSFFVQPGESSQLCYLNDQPLLQATPFSIGDRLTVGETELMFVPFCGDTFVWDR